MKTKNHGGFTLFEILITLTITLICISLTTKLLIYYRQTDKILKEISYINSNIILLNYIIRKEIDQAGHFVCKKEDYIYKKPSIEIINYNNKGRSTIITRYISPVNTKLIAVNNDIIKVKRAFKFYEGDQIVIGNCNKVSNPLTITNKSYENLILKESEDRVLKSIKETKTFFVAKYFETKFEILKTSRKDDSGRTIFGLYSSVNGQNRSELVTNIIFMDAVIKKVVINLKGKFIVIIIYTNY